MAVIPRVVFALALVLSASLPLGGQARFSLSGRVTDEVGSPIPGALIRVRWDRSALTSSMDSIGDTDRTAKADQNGRYTLPLPVGIYDVFVTMDGFDPQCKKLQVGPAKDAIYDAALIASAIVTGHTGFFLR